MTTPSVVDLAQLERDDLVAFLNAGLCATAQQEFYQSALEQLHGITFLHRYISQCYRRLYAQTLALELNHFNKALTIETLLTLGAPREREQAREEGALIALAMEQLPPPRAYKMLARLAARGRSNRRIRAVVRDYIISRPNLPLHVLKYRKQMRTIVRHFHLKLDQESQSILFDFARRKDAYTTPLYEKFRRAHYSKEAIYELPYTLAEGLCVRHRIPRKQFLERIQHTMTRREKERMQQSARQHGASLDGALERMDLTRLCAMVLGLEHKEREARREELEMALRKAAHRAASAWPMHAASIGLVLDNSFSAKGSRAKTHRALVIAFAMRWLADAMSDSVRMAWTSPPRGGDDWFIAPRGQTNLVNPLFEILESPPELIIICSDGYENDPAGGLEAVWELWATQIEPTLETRTRALHINPVFDADGFMPRQISQYIPTVSVHDASNVPFALVVAEFASGRLGLEELHRMIARRANTSIARSQAS